MISAVTAVNFDLRAFDTLGEEAILFAAVTGVVVLMRHMREEDQSERLPQGAHRSATVAR